MNDMTIIWALVGALVGIVGGHLVFVLFDIYQLNKRIKKQKIELEKYKATGGTSFVTSVSRAFSEMHRKDLESQAKRNDKTG